MLIPLSVWNALRPILLCLPSLAAAGLAAALFLSGRRRRAIASVAFAVVVSLVVLAVNGHGFLKPHVVHRLSGGGVDLRLTEHVVLFGKAFEYGGVAYPALKRDILVNDSDCIAFVEQVVYRAENPSSSPLDSLGYPSGGLGLGSSLYRPVEIPPRSVYEKQETPAYDSRIRIDYLGTDEGAPPDSLTKKMDADLRAGPAGWLFNSDFKYWLRWEPYDEDEYRQRKELEAMMDFLRSGLRSGDYLED